MSLPTCSVQSPSCGACGDNTTYTGDGFFCEPCGLYYGDGEDGTEAEFYNEDAKPCGKPCDNYWHRDHKITPDAGFECTSCLLPASHTSECWTDCKYTDIEGGNQ